MIEAFEKALCDNSDLDATAKHLTEQVHKQQQEQIRLIQHDLNHAKLILEALNEPVESGMYTIAKTYIRSFRKKHCPDGDRIAHLLLKETENYNGKEQVKHDTTEGKQSEGANTETIVRESG